MKKVISTPNAPAAIGPYSQAIEVGNMVFLSGQIPVNPATGDVVEGGIKEQTTQVFENIKAVLAEAGLTLDNVVKTTVFLADISMFVEMNEVYATYFSGAFPARSAFAVKQLPKGALVEIESIAVRDAGENRTYPRHTGLFGLVWRVYYNISFLSPLFSCKKNRSDYEKKKTSCYIYYKVYMDAPFAGIVVTPLCLV